MSLFSIPTTSSRVPEHTVESVNEHIRQKAEERLEKIGNNPERIAARLQEIDQEWDIERVVETHAATVMLFGIGMAAIASRRWLIPPIVSAALLLRHAVKGGYPPLFLFRSLGFRTEREIEEERHVLLSRQETAAKLH